MPNALKYLVSILFVLLCVAGTKAPPVFLTGNGTINFRSDTRLEFIRASSKELKGAIDTDKKSFSFKIRMRSFQGFNSPLQREHFNENYMESESYPEATFNGKIIEDIDFTTPGKYSVRAKGILFIHGIEQERIIKSEIEIKTG